MINPFYTTLKFQEQFLLASWKLNCQLLKGYAAFIDESDPDTKLPISKMVKHYHRRCDDWQRHVLPEGHRVAYRSGRLDDHYGKRSNDVDVEKL